MEVIIPKPAIDFDFNSGRSSPHLSSTPSTPKRFGEFYYSAPNSPSSLSQLYVGFDEKVDIPASVPFDWEEKPGTPKSPLKSSDKRAEQDDFAFDFSAELEKASRTADELFDGGVIRPLKPPPRLQFDTRKKTNDQFVKRMEDGRGRERSIALPSSSSGRRGSRSLSPIRVSQLPWKEEERKLQLQYKTKQSPLSSKPSNSSSSSSSKSKGKWRLKDFLLFRSASEGRASDKDPLRKYSALFRRNDEWKNSSFRSIDSAGPGSSSRRRGPISAHELHYTINRAVSEDLKKKTFLPYKQGILGRLAFNPAIHALTNKFGSFSRS